MNEKKVVSVWFNLGDHEEMKMYQWLQRNNVKKSKYIKRLIYNDLYKVSASPGGVVEVVQMEETMDLTTMEGFL